MEKKFEFEGFNCCEKYIKEAIIQYKESEELQEVAEKIEEEALELGMVKKEIREKEMELIKELAKLRERELEIEIEEEILWKEYDEVKEESYELLEMSNKNLLKFIECEAFYQKKCCNKCRR